jgi:uncharacterized membrane protein YeaQ/YmgE (transglycosylase-associated protein family)
MADIQTALPLLGAVCFGAVVGWLANHVLEKATQVDVTWLGSMVGVIGGGAVTALFEPRSQVFGAYCIGLATAFFIRVVVRPVTQWFGLFVAQETERELKNPDD